MRRKYTYLAMILVAMIAVILWKSDNFHAVITAQVYRSAQLNAARLDELVTEYGIQSVISLRQRKPDERWYAEEIETLRTLGINYHSIPMYQTFGPRIDQLIELRDLIESTPRPLLIHCKAGADRTGLASVMTKLLDGSSTLAQARAQVSWKYHAIRSNSMGIPFFNQYEGWLNSRQKPHSRDNFNFWLENEYVDLSGNIHFLIDPIGQQVWERPWGKFAEGREFEISREDNERLDLSGWAFDTQNTTMLKSVEPTLGKVRFTDTTYGIAQPWLKEFFSVEDYLVSGWTASHPMKQFANGCHELSLKFTRLDGSIWVSPPSARICIR